MCLFLCDFVNYNFIILSVSSHFAVIGRHQQFVGCLRDKGQTSSIRTSSQPQNCITILWRRVPWRSTSTRGAAA